MPYEMQVDDNFHYGDSENWTTGLIFESEKQAVAYCKPVVDQYLAAPYLN